MIRYEVTDNGYCATAPHENYKVCEITEFEEELTNRYRELLSQKHDLERATACLNQMFFNKDTSLIDGALINTAIQLLVRCFTKSGSDDRMQFNYFKVFKKYAVQNGEEDLSEIYLKFYNARNKVISHDELNYTNNIVGITMDDSGNACDITELTVSTHYVYEQNKSLLLRLLRVATAYCSEQLEHIKNQLIEKYNATSPKPVFSIIDSKRLSGFGAFNKW